MKRSTRKTVLWVALFLTVTIMSSTVAGVVQAKPIKLLFANFEPPMGPLPPVMQEFANELKAKSNGRVETTLSLGGALGKPGEYFDLTSKGLCDMALCVPGFGGPGRFPMSEVFGLPWVFPSGEISSKAMVAIKNKGYLDKEFSGVKLLTVSGAHGDMFYTKGKPVTSLSDFKGQKIWNVMPLQIEVLKRLGATPVGLPPYEMYPALQKGVLTGAICNFQFLFTFKLAEQLRYNTELSMGGVTVATVVNKKIWNKLPSDIQEMMIEMSDKYSIKYGLSFDAVADKGREAFAKQGGKKVGWKPGEKDKVYAKIAPLWKEWIESKEKKGAPAQKAVDDLYYALKGLGVNSPAVGYSPK